MKMYQIVVVEDEIRVPPENLSMTIEDALMRSIADKYESTIDNKIGVILTAINIEELGEGKVIPGDAGVYFPTKFSLLTWLPKEKEIVEGEVVDITEFGVFVRIGAIDGLVHISQIMDDFVSYDEKNSILFGKSTKKILKEGDKVRARVISVSLKEENKVGLTMRQPFLGALHWLEKEATKEEKKEEKEKSKKK
jgi:DNA-directed RNA polymerase subunit E'